MHIAFFTNTYSPFVGGVETSVRLFKEELERQGHEVTVFAPSYPGHRRSTRDVIRVRSVEAPTYPGFYLPLTFLPGAERAFEKLEADIVHVHYPFLLGDAGVRLARKHGLPVLFTYHTLYERYLHYLPLPEGVARAFVDQLLSSFCDRCDLVLAPSDYVAKKAGAMTSVPVETLPTGIKLQEVRETGTLRDEHDIPDDATVLLYVGRLVKEKNLDFLFDALADVMDEESVFVLVGDGEERAQLEKRQLPGRVIFTGSREDVGACYADADLFVFSSQSETQGLVLLEAMAHGLPVVALDGPAVGEYLDGNGALCANKEEFVDAARRFLQSEHRRAEASRRARETAKRYSIEAMTKRLIAAYKGLLRRKEAE